jgi:hypothetical protein
MNWSNKSLSIVCALLCNAAFVYSASAQEGAVQHVHDPHIIKAGGVYCVFSTGKGISIRRSRDLKRWGNAGRVFDEDVPAGRMSGAADERRREQVLVLQPAASDETATSAAVSPAFTVRATATPRYP